MVGLSSDVPVSGGAVGGAVGAVVVIVLIVAAVVVAIAIVLQYQRHRTDSKDIENKKEEETAPHYETIKMEIPQNTHPVDGANRESVYTNDFEKNFALQLILESKTSAKV